MSIFENFTTFNFEEGVAYLSITKNGATFNKGVVIKMGYPQYVQLLVNSADKKIAVKSCDKSAENSVEFYKEKPNVKTISVRWNVKDLLNTLQDIMGVDLEKSSYRIEGSFIKEENAVLFDLTEAKELL